MNHRFIRACTLGGVREMMNPNGPGPQQKGITAGWTDIRNHAMGLPRFYQSSRWVLPVRHLEFSHSIVALTQGLASSGYTCPIKRGRRLVKPMVSGRTDACD
jgi:hypothetical protein